MSQCLNCKQTYFGGVKGGFCSESCQKDYIVTNKILNEGITFPLELAGTNGILQLHQDYVKFIRPAGCFTPISPGQKEIPIKNITGVQMKTPDSLTVGFIQFTIPGGKESLGGAFEAAKDENSLTFRSGFGIAEQIKKYIMEKNSAPSVIIQSNVNSVSKADEIKKLKELLDMGALTQEEFEKEKHRILK
ncbi:hypothetical protein C4588_05840 [Candidatus Parcubacteria bacterium]|nr:MAG: hypothetical protein C4588_05840 [Candidatus Parcubacteria bacterium]